MPTLTAQQQPEKTISMVAFFGVGGLLLLGSIVASLALGAVALPFTEIWAAFTTNEATTTSTVLFHHRLPRVLMGCTAGAGLSLAGLVFQCILRNPLAEPYILGISGGAAVGSILALLLGFSGFMGSIGALAGSLVVLTFVLLCGTIRNTPQSLLLSGVMLNAFCGAIILFLISLAKPGEISTIMFWFMGNLGAASLPESTGLLFLWVIFFGITLHSHKLNILSLGTEAAQSLGLNANRNSLLFLMVVSLMVSILTAKVGPLGFVGLVIPQVLRLIVGHDARLLAAGSLLYGASFLTLCDLLARTLPPQGELPVGVLTALIGAPAFIFLQGKKP